MSKHLARVATAAASLSLAMAMAACGGSSSGSNTSGSGSGSASGSGDASAKLAAAYKGITGTVPTESPGKPKSGVTAWIISCGMQVPSCATPAQSMQEAAKKIGWSTKICDGQLNPNGWGTCVRQGVSSKATVIFPIGIDCASIKAPFEEAKAAKVTVVGAGGADCGSTGGTNLWATERLQIKDTSVEQYWKNNGKLQADWLIGKTNGKAKVVQLSFTDPVWGPWLAQGFKDEMATCSGCKIVNTLQVSNNDLVSGQLATKFSTALLQNADADSVEVPVGAWLSAGLAQAVQSSGKASKIKVVGGFGDASTMDLVRKSPIEIGLLGYATAWGAYGSIDTAIRVLNGQKPVVEGDGFQMVDKDHNMPASGDYQGDVDFKSQYLKLWGVS